MLDHDHHCHSLAWIGDRNGVAIGLSHAIGRGGRGFNGGHAFLGEACHRGLAAQTRRRLRGRRAHCDRLNEHCLSRRRTRAGSATHGRQAGMASHHAADARGQVFFGPVAQRLHQEEDTEGMHRVGVADESPEDGVGGGERRVESDVEEERVRRQKVACDITLWLEDAGGRVDLADEVLDALRVTRGSSNPDCGVFPPLQPIWFNE